MQRHYKARTARKQPLSLFPPRRRNYPSTQLKTALLRSALGGSRKEWKFCKSAFKLFPELRTI
jgi:hypothetical protein